MNLNVHSITFKALSYLIAFSMIFVLSVSLSITSIFSKTYINVEKEKISQIEKTISPSLSLNLSYDFDEAVQEVLNNTLKDKNILLVKIKTKKENLLATRDKKTLTQHVANDEFISISKLIDPTSSEEIAQMTIVYSNDAYNEYMKELYTWLFWGIFSIFIFIAILIFLLLKSLNRLTELASSLNSFDPNEPRKLNLNTTLNDEISSISKSANKMVENLIKYLDNSKKLNVQLSKNQAHLKDAQRIAKVGSWEYDVTNDILLLSDEIYRMLALKRNVKLTWTDYLHQISQIDKEYIISVLDNAIINGSYFDIKYSINIKVDKILYIHTRGKVRKKVDGSTKITAVSMDITQDTKNKKIIEKLAYYDPLTNLPNRSLLKDRIHKAMQNASRQNTKIAILFLDLDHFKLINDTLGHNIGDKLLIYISKLLQKEIRKSDTLSRIGGDEFVILLPNIDSINAAQYVAKNLLKILHGKHDIDSHQLYVTTSIGISIYPDNANTLDELITNADTAMYDAKQDGRNKYKIYTNQMTNFISTQMKIEQDLKNAVNNKNELEIYYQPKIDIKDNFVSGAEALIRWNHPENGLMFPDEFIGVAESTGIILELGMWIIEECILQVKEWNKLGFVKIKLAINLSARQFQDDALVPFIDSIIKEHHIDPVQLEFEITETISMSNMDATLRILNELKNIGVSIAIDDFGTGYSSLSYLKKFPINTLKIDKSFVMDMTIDEEDKVIVKTIITMAHSLGCITVAEGVETKEHRDILADLKCDQIQGYYYSKPIPKDMFSDFLLNYNPTADSDKPSF